MSDFNFRIIGDNPAKPGEDKLKFGDFIEPIADRLLDSRDNTPFTVGIHAPWGQGKSTVMNLLEHTLKERDKKIQTLFFYPWKYHTREEVWRGLVLAMVRKISKHDSLAREWRRKWPGIEKAVHKSLWRQLFGFLLFVKSGDADLLVDAIATEPWSPGYLHGFEQVLEDRFKDLQPGGEHPLFVLFVDDLDRCLPESATAVLEALKLVLNQPGLITVLGVADQELIRAVNSIYSKALGDQAEELMDGKWGNVYLHKIIQIPIYLPRVSDQAFDDYINNCLKQSRMDKALMREEVEGKPLVNPARWSPVLRKTCDGNLRDIKRFINRFIAEWEKATAGTDMEIRPERVAFILLLERLRPEFTQHCFTAADLGLLIQYQKWFLDDSAANGERSPPAGTESKYLEAHDLETLFRDTMRRPRGGNEPLVELFRTQFDLIGYIRFGRTDLPSEPENEAAEVVVEAREAEVESAEPSVKGVNPEKREPRKKTVRQKPGQLDQLLLRSRESLSENRLDESEKYAQEGVELAARSQEAEQTAAFLGVLTETTLQMGTPSALPRLMDDTYHLTESAFGAGQWPVAHAALERVKARFRDRLR
ncbi:MAG: hypothetical protein GY731_15250, partial [Gammaproteobacteria bacterium]|nr:hypothetical protein [Gammaproteobacteria bacterium]